MFDGFGQEVWGAQVDSYGRLEHVRGGRRACPFRFPGQYEDPETGLYCNRFRYYDPDAGCFASRDPAGLHGGLNLHAYVADPLTWVDELGLTSCKQAGRERLKEAGLEGVTLAGKSFNAGRRQLEAAGFVLAEVTDTGRKVFRNARTGAAVLFDRGAALVAGQKAHWEIVNRAGERLTRSGRVVTGPSPIMGGKHIAAG